MLYKLPKDKKTLSKELVDKVKALDANQQKEWYLQFDDCAINKDLYENLMKKISSGALKADEVNVTIANKTNLEETILQQERELLQRLNENGDQSEAEKVMTIIKAVNGNGFMNVRPHRGK